VTDNDESASRCIYQATRIIETAGGEIEAVRKALDEAIVSIQSPNVKFDVRKLDDDHDKSEWVYVASIDSRDVRIKDNGRLKVKGRASHVFDIGRRDSVAAQFGRAVVMTSLFR